MNGTQGTDVGGDGIGRTVIPQKPAFIGTQKVTIKTLHGLVPLLCLQKTGKGMQGTAAHVGSGEMGHGFQAVHHGIHIG